jgi:uracil-DNA glycosylase family 4
MSMLVPQPDTDCRLCPRLASFRIANRQAEPGWHNAPVPSFGEPTARLLVVGLAPGLRGANRTGRPFTGDYAGDLLYATLLRYGFVAGRYDRRADDGLTLKDCRITNAVRCVPPDNKPTTIEAKTCGRFLAAEIAAMPKLVAILALGLIAHNAVIAVMGERRTRWPFAHGARHRLPGGVLLADSYHCSRYNTNTRRLSEGMFQAVVGGLREDLVAPARQPSL